MHRQNWVSQRNELRQWIFQNNKGLNSLGPKTSSSESKATPAQNFKEEIHPTQNILENKYETIWENKPLYFESLLVSFILFYLFI